MKKHKELRVCRIMQEDTRAKFADTEDKAENYFKSFKEVLNIVEKQDDNELKKALTQKLGSAVQVQSGGDLTIPKQSKHKNHPIQT